MPDTISLTGVVATDPRHITTTEGLDITSFRLASSQRRFDRSRNSWVDVGTNWYTVTAFRQLASNLATSITKGDRVLASGRLRLREWQSGEKTGTTIEVEAEAVGHDLAWGSSLFSKSATAGSTANAISASPFPNSPGSTDGRASDSVAPDVSDGVPAGGYSGTAARSPGSAEPPF